LLFASHVVEVLAVHGALALLLVVVVEVVVVVPVVVVEIIVVVIPVVVVEVVVIVVPVIIHIVIPVVVVVVVIPVVIIHIVVVKVVDVVSLLTDFPGKHATLSVVSSRGAVVHTAALCVHVLHSTALRVLLALSLAVHEVLLRVVHVLLL